MNPLIAVGQMTATVDIEANIETGQSLAKKASDAGASLLSLPECFAFLGEKDTDAREMAQPMNGPLMEQYRGIARQHKIWLALGGFQEEGPDKDRCYNTHVLLDDTGHTVATYRKLHLFDVDIPGGPKLLESNGTIAGDELKVVDSPIGRLGLSICYDLRFPELYLTLAQAGAQILMIPAAFTLTTGKEHWETLLRARAIETQTYVVAAAQRGRHNAKRESFGHAMIIDPWGTIIAQCLDRTDIAVAPIDLKHLEAIRMRIPVWNHRRPEVYGEVGLKTAAE
jgi:deaminated glutathione amidase